MEQVCSFYSLVWSFLFKQYFACHHVYFSRDEKSKKKKRKEITMISCACKYLCKKSQDLKYGYWMLIFYHLQQSFFVLRFDCFFNFFGCTIILLSVFCCKTCVSPWVFHNKFVFSYIKMCEKRLGCWLIVVIIFIKREITHTKVLWIQHTLKSGDRVHVRFLLLLLLLSRLSLWWW